ncbi:hypothetical protein GMA12_02155 [Kocuria sediminis]|uniref:Uncharacterized protein n=1 Tax=Kocuria sediminis TaxID=1038857 RepID=A0A6N8GGA6_9MICC|nr:hypothetical protein [Kocuria sediminis]MUN61958.1 hypothetical protein [Kocuria sediminis]
MRLALPSREPPGAIFSRDASPTMQNSVQRQETTAGAAPSLGLVPADGGTTAVQREAAGATEDSRSTTLPAGPGAAPGGAPAAAPGAAPGTPGDTGMSPEQVDELAQRLVAPIVRRIKADMLLDRERRGLRTDVR